jgi:hypothetical protein
MERRWKPGKGGQTSDHKSIIFVGKSSLKWQLAKRIHRLDCSMKVAIMQQ